MVTTETMHVSAGKCSSIDDSMYMLTQVNISSVSCVNWKFNQHTCLFATFWEREQW